MYEQDRNALGAGLDWLSTAGGKVLGWAEQGVEVISNLPSDIIDFGRDLGMTLAGTSDTAGQLRAAAQPGVDRFTQQEASLRAGSFLQSPVGLLLAAAALYYVFNK